MALMNRPRPAMREPAAPMARPAAPAPMARPAAPAPMARFAAPAPAPQAGQMAPPKGPSISNQNQANQVQLTGQAANLYNQLGQLAPSMLQGMDKNAIAANPAALQPMIQAAQSYNQMMQTPQGQQMLNNLPAGIDKYAVAANPAAYQQWEQQAKAQETARPGSTMFAPQQVPSGQNMPYQGASASQLFGMQAQPSGQNITGGTPVQGAQGAAGALGGLFGGSQFGGGAQQSPAQLNNAYAAFQNQQQAAPTQAQQFMGQLGQPSGQNIAGGTPVQGAQGLSGLAGALGSAPTQINPYMRNQMPSYNPGPTTPLTQQQLQAMPARSLAMRKGGGIESKGKQDAKKVAMKGKTFAKGGKIAAKDWEGSAKDEAQDKKLAKKHKMSMKDWEKSKMDDKHDKQQSMKGLKKGGATKAKVKKMCGGGMKGYKAGGAISGKKADGIAVKGKTRCKIC